MRREIALRLKNAAAELSRKKTDPAKSQEFTLYDYPHICEKAAAVRFLRENGKLAVALFIWTGPDPDCVNSRGMKGVDERGQRGYWHHFFVSYGHISTLNRISDILNETEKINFDKNGDPDDELPF